MKKILIITALLSSSICQAAHYPPLNVKAWELELTPAEIVAECGFEQEEGDMHQVSYVEGKHPFTIVTSNVNPKDKEKHIIKWTMQINPDVGISNFVFVDKGEPYDGVLLHSKGVALNAEKKPAPAKGHPMLCVLILENQNDTSTHRDSPIGRVDQYVPDTKRSSISKRLVIPSYSAAPQFKILLLPYLFGEKLPIVSFDKKTKAYTLGWTDQSVTIDFNSTPARANISNEGVKEEIKRDD